MSREPRSCRRATELISLSMDRPLEPRERRALTAHLAICRTCRVFRSQLEAMRGFLRDPSTARVSTSYLSTNLSDEARARMQAAVEQRLES